MSKTKLIDFAIEAAASRGEDCAKLTEALRSATAISIDNVAKYYYEGTDQERWNEYEDFPNVAPPLKAMWFEYMDPETVVSEKFGVIDQRSRRQRRGFLVVSQETRLANGVDNQDQRWFCRVFSYAKPEHVDVLPFDGPFVEFVYRVGPNGEMLAPRPSQSKDEFGAFTFGWRDDSLLWAKKFTPKTHAELLNPATRQLHSALVKGYFFPVLLAISFMHCKNVTMTKVGLRGPPAPKKNRHKAQASGVRYHVLEIEPLKAVLKKEGGSESSGLRQALHICRGHFKTYGRPLLNELGAQVIDEKGNPVTGPGLFGREDMKGTFWWTDHVRGVKDSGVVVKDYEVKPPVGS